MGKISQFPNSEKKEEQGEKMALLVQLKVAINNLKIAMQKMQEYLPDKEDDEGIPFTHMNSDIIEKLEEVEQELNKFIESSTVNEKYLSWLEHYLVFHVEEFFGKIRYYVSPPTGYLQNALFYLGKLLPSQLYTPNEEKIIEEINKLPTEVREEVLKLKSAVEYITTSLDKIKIYLPRQHKGSSGVKWISSLNSLIDDLVFVLRYITEIPDNIDLDFYAKAVFEKIIIFVDLLRDYYKSPKMLTWIDKISRTCKFALVITNKFIKQQKK